MIRSKCRASVPHLPVFAGLRAALRLALPMAAMVTPTGLASPVPNPAALDFSHDDPHARLSLRQRARNVAVAPEEYRLEYVADRVGTTATVWMKLTMECARCHDQKLDPITQREFTTAGGTSTRT